MIEEFTLKLTPSQAANNNYITNKVSTLAKTNTSNITAVKIIKRSIDARGKQIAINLKVLAVWDEKFYGGSQIEPFEHNDVSKAKEVIVVGAGPAGLFAALTLIERGIRPIVLERGKDVKRRKTDVAELNKNGILDLESNYCFGEGGAGTFSDGKIYTRSNKRGNISRVLELFVLHGANPDILIESHPHLGTDKLPQIITSIRNTITECGGIIRFDSKLTDITIKSKRIDSISINGSETIKASAVILATGHSARDIYEILHRKNIAIQAKAFAMGVRIEHSRELIDSIQYHGVKDSHLPAATYSLSTQVNERGVYSFCMCPGGIIVPSSTGSEELVVNGMSNSMRNSVFSNAGMAVEITLNDIENFAQGNPMAGLEMQKQFEYTAWQQSSGNQKAPAQRLVDFLENKQSQNLPNSSYIPGLCSSPLHNWLPKEIGNRLKVGFETFGKSMRGYITNEAVIVGVESRTSSPVRIPRDGETFKHIEIDNLYPCGEGAGYSGGITSSALDGIACANKVS